MLPHIVVPVPAPMVMRGIPGLQHRPPYHVYSHGEPVERCLEKSLDISTGASVICRFDRAEMSPDPHQDRGPLPLGQILVIPLQQGALRFLMRCLVSESITGLDHENSRGYPNSQESECTGSWGARRGSLCYPYGITKYLSQTGLDKLSKAPKLPTTPPPLSDTLRIDRGR